MPEIKRIYIACDHAALGMKNEIAQYVKEMGYEVFDEGTFTEESTDYPIYAKKVAEKVRDDENSLGLLFCGTGIGMEIAANKIRGIRATVLSDTYSAALSRKHNNANVACFGARVIGIETAKSVVKAFLTAEFEGGRHLRRVEMINAFDKADD